MPVSPALNYGALKGALGELSEETRNRNNSRTDTNEYCDEDYTIPTEEADCLSAARARLKCSVRAHEGSKPDRKIAPGFAVLKR